MATSDGGTTWRAVRRSTVAVGPLDFIDHLRGWAVEGGTLLKTVDGGASWRAVGRSDVLAGAFQLSFLDGRRGWAVVVGSRCDADPCINPKPVGSLLGTTDGGMTWAHPAGDWGVVHAMCWTTGGRGWAGTTTGDVGQEAVHVVTTTDAGRTWSPVPRFEPGPGRWISGIACSGTTAWVVAVSGVGLGHQGYRVQRTVDGGEHWRVALADGMSAAIATTDTTVPSIDAYSGPLAAISPSTAFFIGDCPACGNQPTVSGVVTADAGRTFREFSVTAPSDPGVFPDDVAFSDPLDGWLLGQQQRTSVSGAVFRTSDGGRTWRRVLQSDVLGSTQAHRP